MRDAEAYYNGTGWAALAKRSKKPGLTSVTPGDAFLIEVDTMLKEDDQAVPVLQLTYLQSYEQVGIVRVGCHSGCKCSRMKVNTLQPKRRFATLNTALSGAVSRSKRCVLRVSNESPKPTDGSPPSTKIKLVSLAVLSSKLRRTRGRRGGDPFL